METIPDLQQQLDKLYGELRDSWARGDLGIEDLARIQLETMILLGKMATAFMLLHAGF